MGKLEKILAGIGLAFAIGIVTYSSKQLEKPIDRHIEKIDVKIYKTRTEVTQELYDKKILPKGWVDLYTDTNCQKNTLLLPYKIHNLK
jgi:hypothetical protein